MSDRHERAREYRAKAEELEKRVCRSRATKAELTHLAQQYRRLAEDIEASFGFPETLLVNPADGHIGTA